MKSLTRQLGIPAPDQQMSVDSVWPEVVGPVLAQHARVRSIRNGDCVVEVDGPAWATQLRYLGNALAEGVNERCGRVLVTSVRIVVLRPGNNP
jgi:predicted nucleic acid-binding Zn ribbon protein